GAAQCDLRQRATQNCDRQDSKICFERATVRNRSAVSRFCVRVSRNDEQRQQQSGNFKLVTQRFVSTFSRRATKRQTFTSDPVLNSIFTIFALRPSSSLIQSPMSAASSALPRGEIQPTASRSKLCSSTPTIVNVFGRAFFILHRHRCAERDAVR